MKLTINSRAAKARIYWSKALFIVFFVSLTGCALPTAPTPPAVYDFGVGPPRNVPASTPRPTAQAALVVGEIETAPALDSTAMLYRLAYANPQQLQPYAQARWSMPPAQLLRQRLRARLGEHHLLLNAGDRLAIGVKTELAPTSPPTPPQPVLSLRLELEEFSQLFDSPQQSTGLLVLRATLTQASPTGEQLIAQRSFTLQRPAPTPDAAGGVQALSEASEAMALEVGAWVVGVGR
jgi:cholesterol transport system auxiliary component